MHSGTNAFAQSIAEIVKTSGEGRENLLAVLGEINAKYGYVSGRALIEVSRQMDISIGEIHGVATFYSFINEKNKGTNVIRLCRTISCDMAGKEKIESVIERELGIKFGEMTDDGIFSLEYTNCMGMCDQGPAMLVNDNIYSKLDCDKVIEILEKYKGGV